MDGPSVPSLAEAIEEMILSYQDFNSAIEVYNIDPSSKVYAKHITKNRPFIIRGGCSKWPSAHWSVAYLLEKMDGRSVKVAETPVGNADSVVTRSEDEIQYFVKPLEAEENFSELVFSLQAAATNSATNSATVKYSQGRT